MAGTCEVHMDVDTTLYGRFDPEVFVNCLQSRENCLLCKQLTKTKTSRSKRPAFTSLVCKAAVLLVKSHVDSRHAAMSLYQITMSTCFTRYEMPI